MKLKEIKIFYWLLKVIEAFAVLIYLIIEEVLWVRIGEPVYRRLQTIQFLQRFSQYAEKEIGEWGFFVIFSIPFIIMEILGILSGKMFITGHFFIGMMLYVLKGFCTPIVVYIFNIGRDKLLSFKIIYWTHHFICWLSTTEIYISVKIRIKATKKAIKAFLSRFKTKKSFWAGFKKQLTRTTQKLRKILRRRL